MRTFGYSIMRVSALSQLEFMQLRRSALKLLAMLGLPLLLPITTMHAYGADLPIIQALATAEMGLVVTLAMLFFMAPVVMLVHRREIGYLQKLRSTQLRDMEILLAAFMPSMFLSLLVFLFWTVCFSFKGLPFPAHPLQAVLGMLVSLAISISLVLITAGLTRDEEAVQLTMLPGLLLIALGPSETIRRVLNDTAIGNVLDWSPLSAAFDSFSAAYLGEPNSIETVVALCWMFLLSGSAILAFRWNSRS